MIREGHADAGQIRRDGQLPRAPRAYRLEQPAGRVRGQRQDDRIGIMRGAAGHRDVPALPQGDETGDSLSEAHLAREPLHERSDRLGHSLRKAAKPRRHFALRCVDPQQRGRAAFIERGQLAPVPERRATRLLIDYAIGDAERVRERRQLRLTGEEAVGAAFDYEILELLGDDDSTGAPFALEDDDLVAARAGELPGGSQPRDSCADNDDFQSQPRCPTAARTASATAATSPGSSLSESVRSS